VFVFLNSKSCLFSLINSIQAVKFLGNPVENKAKNVEKAIFSIFFKIQKKIHPYPENLEIQNFNLALLDPKMIFSYSEKEVK
jgi:hypothetical protein